MLLYCLNFKENTESKNQRVVKKKIGKLMLLSKCAACGCKKSKCFKEKEASRLLSSLGIKSPLSQMVLFYSEDMKWIR